MQHDRSAEAEAVLNRLHQSQEARIEVIQIQQAIRLEHTIQSSWSSLITKKSYRKRTILAIYVCITSQMMGTYCIVQYSPIIYSSLGFDLDTVLHYTLGFVTYGSGMLCLGGLFVDKLPRTLMMSIGLFGTAFSLATAAVLIAVYTMPEALANPNAASLRAAVAFIYITLTWYQMFYEPLIFAFLAEIFSTQIRAKGMVLGVTIVALVNILWLQVGPIAFKNIGWKFYLCYIIPSLVCGIITLLYVPDTLRLPLEEVSKHFGDYDDGDVVDAMHEALEAEEAAGTHVEKLA
jgi:hypothetical protein